MNISLGFLIDNPSLIDKCHNALKSIGFATRHSSLAGDSVRKYQLGSTLTIDLLQNKTISSLRRMTGRPCFSSLLHVTISDNMPNPTQPGKVYSMSILQRILSQNGHLSGLKELLSENPILLPYVSVDYVAPNIETSSEEICNTENFSTRLELQEVVFPINMSVDTNIFLRNTVSTYSLRSFPLNRVAVVLKVDDICNENLLRLLKDSGIQVEYLGHKCSEYQQLQLDIPGLRAFDLRLTSSHKIAPYFLEGPLAVLDGKIMETQSCRVLGGSDCKNGSLRNTKPMNYTGDCWLEVRQMMKRVFTNPSLIYKVYPRTNSSLKPPSIHE